MKNLNEITNNILRDVNESLAVAVVDLSSGLLFSVAHNVPHFTQSYLDAVAAAAVDMFRGKTVTTVEKLLTAQRGREIVNSIKEVQMTTEATFHFMSVVPDKPNALVVLITTKRANLGMGWAALRAALPQIKAFCP